MSDPPEGLKARGRALWRSLGVADPHSAAGVVAVEACRTADRLDELDRIIAGKGVLDLMRFRLHPSWWDDDGEHVTVEVKFGAPLAEARQQSGRLTQLLEQVEARSASAPPAPEAGQESPLARVLREAQERAAAARGERAAEG